MTTKYFMFSYGEYSDYCVGGMYITGKDVPEDAWKEHIIAEKAIAKEREIQSKVAFSKAQGWEISEEGLRYGSQFFKCSELKSYWSSDEHKAYSAGCTDITQSFIDKWELEQVGYEECHEGDY